MLLNCIRRNNKKVNCNGRLIFYNTIFSVQNGNITMECGSYLIPAIADILTGYPTNEVVLAYDGNSGRYRVPISHVSAFIM